MRWILLILFLSLFVAPAAFAADAELPAITNSLGMKLRLLPAGRFQMGVDLATTEFDKHFNTHARYQNGDEWPAHPVRLTKPFYLGETEVTIAQFKAFVEATQHRTTAEKSGQGIDGFQPKPPEGESYRDPAFEQRAEFTWRKPGFEQKDDHPVVGVSYDDAKAFCQWLSAKEKVTYRLPTEAEWEYACRAGTNTWFAWGDDFAGVIHKQANVGNVELEKAYPKRLLRQWQVNVDRDPGDGHVFTAPVGSFPANAWGLRDMHGNVWEWCEDHYSDTFYKTFERERYNTPLKLAIDPMNAAPWNEHGAWRVIRGGCWFTAPVQCRTQTRGYFEATDAGCYLGFRVVREAPAEAVDAARNLFEREQKATRRVQEAVGQFMAGENSGRNGMRATIKPDTTIGPDLRDVPGLIDIVVDHSNLSMPAKLIADIAAIDGLRSLVIHNLGNEVTDADLTPLAGKTTLERLNLQGPSRIGDPAVAHLARLSNLRELRLHSPAITDAGLSRLSLKKLEHLQLIGTASGGACLAAFEGAPLAVLYHWSLADDHAKHLRLFPQLRELNLAGSPLSADGFAHVAALRRLQHLDVTNCKSLTPDSFAALGKLDELQQLNLEGTGAGDEACKHLARLQRLADLHIGSAGLTDAGLEHLGTVVSLRQVRITRPAAITDRGLRHLWRLDQLSFLLIECNGITGTGLGELADLKQLRTLLLDGTGTTDEGLKQVPLLAQIEHLRLGSNRGGPPAVTDAGLMHLATAAKLRTLEITRRDTKITDAGIAALQRAAPELRIQVR